MVQCLELLHWQTVPRVSHFSASFGGHQYELSKDNPSLPYIDSMDRESGWSHPLTLIVYSKMIDGDLVIGYLH